jgi:mRNA-degrading endonuclease toxin of MazEF toxin-antitoxin module
LVRRSRAKSHHAMRQWEIYLFPYRDELPHPVVILSSEERCANEAITHVNGLLCTSVRLNRELKRHEAVLDETDGLDWKTAARCDFIYALPKNEFLEKRGEVSRLRRVAITRKLIDCLRLPLEF